MLAEVLDLVFNLRSCGILPSATDIVYKSALVA